jgi:hypothetical protein
MLFLSRQEDSYNEIDEKEPDYYLTSFPKTLPETLSIFTILHFSWSSYIVREVYDIVTPPNLPYHYGYTKKYSDNIDDEYQGISFGFRCHTVDQVFNPLQPFVCKDDIVSQYSYICGTPKKNKEKYILENIFFAPIEFQILKRLLHDPPTIDGKLDLEKIKIIIFCHLQDPKVEITDYQRLALLCYPQICIPIKCDKEIEIRRGVIRKIMWMADESSIRRVGKKYLAL